MASYTKAKLYFSLQYLIQNKNLQDTVGIYLLQSNSILNTQLYSSDVMCKLTIQFHKLYNIME